MGHEALQIKGLHKVYESGTVALRGIDLSMQAGEFLALLGPNGAGKSTTIGILSALVNKTAGQVAIFGYDIDRQLAAAKKQLGVVPQEFNFSQFEQVSDIIVTQAGYYGMPRREAQVRCEELLDLLGLSEKRHAVARTLSGGMKRRLMIARALVHRPRLLILDEPTAGVDIELRRSMWDFLSEINRQGTSIILTTHYLEEAEALCRRIAIIDQGRLIEDTDTRSLLATLHAETFVFDLAAPLQAALSLPWSTRQSDSQTLEVTLRRGESLNEVFACLTQYGVQVVSMRNKANRLEELFVARVERSLRKEGGGV